MIIQIGRNGKKGDDDDDENENDKKEDKRVQSVIIIFCRPYLNPGHHQIPLYYINTILLFFVQRTKMTGHLSKLIDYFVNWLRSHGFDY